jgi:hypothetical protein
MNEKFAVSQLGGEKALQASAVKLFSSHGAVGCSLTRSKERERAYRVQTDTELLS